MAFYVFIQRLEDQTAVAQRISSPRSLSDFVAVSRARICFGSYKNKFSALFAFSLLNACLVRAIGLQKDTSFSCLKIYLLILRKTLERLGSGRYVYESRVRTARSGSLEQRLKDRRRAGVFVPLMLGEKPAGRTPKSSFL